MDTSTGRNIFKRSSRKRQQHDIIFGLEYYVNINVKIKCGFSASGDFKPMLWFQQNRNNYLGFSRDEWIHLMAYKEYIQLKLDHNTFPTPDTILDHPTLENIKLHFKYKKRNGECRLILTQHGNVIELDSDSWRNLIRVGIFLSSFLCWNSILQRQLCDFYHNFYIPKCVELKKTEVQLSEINGIYGNDDIKIELTRLCFEISRVMQKQIKLDIKILKLLRRTTTKNKIETDL